MATPSPTPASTPRHVDPPAPRPGTLSRIRCAAIDLLHGHNRAALVIGPLDLPSRADAADRIVRLARMGPHTRVGLLPSPHRREWVFDPDAAADSIVDAPPPVPGADPARLLDVLYTLPHRPLRIVLAGDHLALDYDHGLGDLTLLNLIVDVIVGAVDPSTLPRRGPAVSPLLVASAITVADPRRAAALLRFHKRRDTVDPMLARRPVPPRRPVSANVHIPASGVDAVRAARAGSMPGTGLFAIHTVALVAALTEAGVRLDPMVTLPFDARPYLPTSMRTYANFSAGLSFPVHETTSAAELQHAMTASARMGRPTANLALATLKTLRRARSRGTAATSTQHVPAEGPVRAELLHSSVGHLPGHDRGWQWSDPARATVIGVATPPSAAGITVTTGFVDGGISMTAAFRDDIFDPARIRAAMDAVAGHAARIVGVP
ncbi:hypothetical protein [Gordonia sp. NPDC058843]|uniref:hypothetical protein n=1 Tax=Gordonia sp. NPDC058843 TaxID=3346648 RepID=UPI003678215E